MAIRHAVREGSGRAGSLRCSPGLGALGGSRARGPGVPGRGRASPAHLRRRVPGMGPDRTSKRVLRAAPRAERGGCGRGLGQARGRHRHERGDRGRPGGFRVRSAVSSCAVATDDPELSPSCDAVCTSAPDGVLARRRSGVGRATRADGRPRVSSSDFVTAFRGISSARFTGRGIPREQVVEHAGAPRLAHSLQRFAAGASRVSLRAGPGNWPSRWTARL